MNRKIFRTRKEELTNLITTYLKEDNIEAQDRLSLNKLLGILNQYSYENRLVEKGLLSHTIVDSLELDYSLGEKFIQFDNEIR